MLMLMLLMITTDDDIQLLELDALNNLHSFTKKKNK